MDDVLCIEHAGDRQLLSIRGLSLDLSCCASDHLQEIVVFNLDFPSDTSSVKFRAVQWICTEVMLAVAALANLMPRKLLALIHFLPILTKCSKILPLHLLALVAGRAPRLCVEHDLAADWDQKYVWLPFCS